MSSRELEILALAVRYASAVDAANPEVGMGPSVAEQVRAVADRLSFAVCEADCRHVTREVLAEPHWHQKG